MYRLYHLGSLSDPNYLWLEYDWAGFDNSEWRPCVEHFVKSVEARGHEVVAIPPPPFERGEDFVPIEYLLGGVRTTFTSDHLLSLIEITTEDPQLLRDVWSSIGDDVGWVSTTASSKPEVTISSKTSGTHWLSALWCRIRG